MSLGTSVAVPPWNSNIPFSPSTVSAAPPFFKSPTRVRQIEISPQPSTPFSGLVELARYGVPTRLSAAWMNASRLPSAAGGGGFLPVGVVGLGFSGVCTVKPMRPA